MRRVIAIAVGAVVGFVLGVLATVFGGAWLLSYVGVGPFSSESYAAKEVRKAEERLGVSCQSVDDRARRFIAEQMTTLRSATRDGKLWFVEGRGKFLDEVKLLEEQAMRCGMIQAQAMAGNLPYPGDFRKLHSLLNSLRVYVTASDKAPPDDRTTRSVLLGQLEKEYRDLTLGSSGRPQAGAAEPKR